VFITAADPVRTGLVASLSRPEANVTGVAMVGATLEPKRLELLHELAPQASMIGVLINPVILRPDHSGRKSKRPPIGSG